MCDIYVYDGFDIHSAQTIMLFLLLMLMVRLHCLYKAFDIDVIGVQWRVIVMSQMLLLTLGACLCPDIRVCVKWLCKGTGPWELTVLPFLLKFQMQYTCSMEGVDFQRETIQEDISIFWVIIAVFFLDSPSVGGFSEVNNMLRNTPSRGTYTYIPSHYLRKAKDDGICGTWDEFWEGSM